MDFDRLNEILKEKHISRRKLAMAVGIPESTMSTAFSRQSGLSPEAVKKIADFLGVSYEYLQGWNSIEDETKLYMKYFFPEHDNSFSLSLALIDDLTKGRLINAYGKLNRAGQMEAVKRIEELTEIPRYTKPDTEQGN